MQREAASARCFLFLGAISAATAVALGAAGMHALKARLAANDPGGLFQVALDYHQLQSLALIVVGLTVARFPAVKCFRLAGWLIILGIALFSGSLYLRSLTGIWAPGVTPSGGITLITAWLVFALGAWRSNRPG